MKEQAIGGDVESGAFQMIEKPLTQPDKSTAPENKQNGGKKEDEDKIKPQASLGEVFSFAKTTNVRLLMVGAFAAAIVSGLVLPAMCFYFAAVFEKLGGDPDSDKFMKVIREQAYTFLVLGVIAFAFMMIQTALMETAADEMTKELKEDWFKALLRQDMAYYDIRDASSQTSIISTNGRQYKKGVGRKLVTGVQMLVAFIGGLVYSFYSSWSVSLTVLACAPLMTVTVLLLVKLNSSATLRKNKSYAKAGSIVTMSVSSIRTILSLNAVQEVIDKFVTATEEAYRGSVGQAHLLGFAYGSQMASMLLSYIPVTLFGAYIMYRSVRDTGCDPSGAVPFAEPCDPSGKDVFGALMGITICASVLPQVSVALEALTGARVACHPALIAINRTVTVADRTDPDRDAKNSHVARKNDNETDSFASSGDPVRRGSNAPLPKYVIDSSSEDGIKPSSIVGNIVFQDVTFSYPTRKEIHVFEHFSLSIEAGKTVAIVGPSGGGKSTAVQLIERFYDPDEGTVTLDGNDLKTLNVRWLRQHIGLVNQEPTLFPMSIKDNIKIARPNATDAEVEEAARIANADHFISKFPNGYDTEVGDKGAQLSGGEKQRIAIARVVLKKTPILLLDESTSALDSESEKVVQEALDKLMLLGNHTTVVIAHRLSTIRNADVIAVLDGGRLVESGKHDDLLAKHGKYYELVESQKLKPEAPSQEEIGQQSDIEKDQTAPLFRASSSFVGEDDDAVLRFRNVWFSYPTRPKKWVFSGLNLSVFQGETLALVGPSGQGKSTVVQLLEAFYRPTKGTIEFFGVDMEKINIRWLRDQMGLVGQEPAMFDLTIAENIRLGCPDATQEDIEEACIKANAHNFILEFPDGYDTQMGEGGSQVSGGEKQRIAIARVLIRSPQIILLDEATSALDSTSEKVVQDALDKIMEDSNQTTIVIAHRLSTIRNADRIAVIDNGKVCEIGTHEELMAKPDGHYRRLQSMQNLEKGEPKDYRKSNKRPEKSLTKSPKDDNGFSDEVDEEIEIDDKKASTLSSRARLLGKEDWPFYIVGGLGAIMAGLFFPAYGFVFADMIEVLYYPVLPCNLTVQECSEYFNDAADAMKEDSFTVSYQIIGLMAIVLVGFVVLFYGFGAASERMNKRVRDAAFKSLVRQEVAWFDQRPTGTIVSRIAEDAALLHAFAGEPIRTMSLSIASVFVGLVVSFFYMWPFALLAISTLPFLSFGALAEMKLYMGEDEGDANDDHKHSSSQIAIESISNIRTVAALGLEEDKAGEYSRALAEEDPSPMRSNFIKGSSSGLGMLVQMWGMALLFWWGGWLLANYNVNGHRFAYRDYLISMFVLLFSLYGIALAADGMADRDKAKRAAARIFDLIDRKSLIDPLSEEGTKNLWALDC